MTTSEALQEIRKQVHRKTDNCDMTISKDCYKKVVSALEKQIPKKPIAEDAKDYEGNIFDDVFRCPECNRTICLGIEGNFAENYPHCNCGQALDWSDTE